MTLIVIMGPQGSGKGTQGELLEDKGYTHVAMGDVLKDIMRSDHPKADMVKEYIERGDLIPDDLNNDILDDTIHRVDDNIILDGYPRDHAQAEHLIDDHDVDLVVDIEISDDEAIRRLSKRRVCTATHKSYSVDEITEEDRKTCRAQGGKIIQREDDTPEAIQHRLDIYHDQTQPLISFFDDHDIPVETIDGEQTKQGVHDDIVDAINKCT
jgi:adenylate kinase